MSTLPRDSADDLQQAVELAFDHAVATDADRTDKFWKCPAGKRLRVDSVQYINVTGLAEASANAALLSVNNGATVIASWDTDSDLSATDVSIPADAFIDFNMAADDEDRIVEEGDVLSFVINESGTTTVPAGRVIVHGRYV